MIVETLTKSDLGKQQLANTPLALLLCGSKTCFELRKLSNFVINIAPEVV